jgi:hypothetical protein
MTPLKLIKNKNDSWFHFKDCINVIFLRVVVHLCLHFCGELGYHKQMGFQNDMASLPYH